MEIQRKVIAIGGPTASGKTSLSLTIARRFNGEIVNCDSRQVYKYLDIGTAKEPIENRNSDNSVNIGGITHHLIDFIDPKAKYTLSDFQKDAIRTIWTISDNGSLPILVGGTGLYIDAVIYNYNLPQQKIDPEQREELLEKTTEELQNILKQRSPKKYESMNQSDQNNPRRLIRAIEHSLEEYDKILPKRQKKFDTLYLVVDIPDEILTEKIRERTQQMFKNGLLRENEELRKKGYTTDLPALQTIGYQEFDTYFDGTKTLEETQELIELHTRQYAKRQKTWFRRNKEAHWVSNENDAIKLAEKFLATEPAK